MTDIKKMEWLANELTDFLHSERSDTPCDFYSFCRRKDCKYQYDFDGGAKCSDCLIENIDKFAKPTLTEDERVILENINTEEWKVIYRTIHGNLELHTRVCDADEACGWTAFYGFNHLFKFIENNNQYSIKELLEND